MSAFLYALVNAYLNALQSLGRSVDTLSINYENRYAFVIYASILQSRETFEKKSQPTP